MSRGTLKHIMAIAQKNPRVKVLLDSVDAISADDIAAADVPAWIKKQLFLLKEANRAAIEANKLAHILLANSTQITAEYELYRYEGDTCVIGSSLTIECNNGDIFLIISPTDVKLNATVVKVRLDEVSQLVSESTHLGKTDLNTYIEVHLKKFLDDKYGTCKQEGSEESDVESRGNGKDRFVVRSSDFW